VRTEINLKGNSMHAVRALVLALVGLCALAATAAQAAAPPPPAPTPALKAIGITAPTHLPPRQSEVQRVTVEGEGGSFTLTPTVAEGRGTLDFGEGIIETAEGSNIVHLYATFVGAFGIGQTVTGGGLPEGTTILAIKGEGEETELELSNSATESTGGFYQAGTKMVSGFTSSSGQFVAGQDISGPGIAPGTTIAALGAGTLTLSALPIGGGTVTLRATPTTAPIPYNASAAAVQAALEALPGYTQGLLTVSGGPGGDAAHPYFLEFGGPLADQNVQEVLVDGSDLEGEHHFATVLTTVPGGVGTGEIILLPSNVGGLPSSGTITAKIGPLPQGILSTGKATGVEWHCPGAAGETTITCTLNEPLRALHASANGLSVPVEVQSSAAPNATAPVEISGGGSPEASIYQVPIVVSSEPARFGVAAAWAGSFEADGSPSTQAGGHPFDSAAYAMANSVRLVNGAFAPAGDSKNIVVDLPPGFVGNPLAGPRCPQSVVIEPEAGSAVCNESETVGNLDPFIGAPNESLQLPSRLFNDMPPKGVAGEFTTKLAFPFQSIVAGVNSEEDFGIRLTAPNNPNYDKIYGFFAAFEGVPAHGNGEALLTNPTDCAESVEKAPVAKAKADTFQEPGSYAEIVVPQPALTGCENLQYTAFNANTNEGQVSFSFVPTSTTGSSPVGAIAHLHVDQSGLTDPKRLASPELKNAVIKLPAGLSLNPSAANGLESCSEAQIGYLGKSFPMPTPIRFNEAQPACPDGSKLGTAEIRTPLLDNPLVGAVYLANQEENPYDSLLAIYFVVNDPLTGVLIKVPGEVQADPSTGRLTAVFQDNPQLPFNDLILNFRGGGQRSEFGTSEVCGNYPTEGEWTPWSFPESGGPALTSASFSLETGCSSSPAARPFSPSFEAGTVGTQGGAYSPLVIKVNRKDGEQELANLNFTLPAGLIGKLAGIPRCSDAQIAEAAGKPGRQELASWSCPAGSLLGVVDAAAGIGSEPVHVGGNVYLAGPYKGAPISAVAIIPAVAGPFDLGDVVVRTPIYINPESAALTIKTDPIPTILRGIPLKVQSVAISINRPNFILNPTNCNVKSASGVFAGSSGATATPTTRFQNSGCAGLAFKPKLGVSTSAKTSKANGASLHVTLAPPHQGPQSAGQTQEANIGRVKVDLPKQLPSRLTTLQKACTSAQFDTNPAGCPAASIVGTAVAHTPLLANPLTGPAYFVSRGNEAFPQLVLVLQGEEITVQLVGDTFISRAGITSSTFAHVPDVPISSFELTLPEGKFSALAANANLCTQKLAMPTEFAAQNGTVLKQSTPIAVEGCPNSISIVSHSRKGRKLTISVSVPAAGKLAATGKGLSKASKASKGRETIKLALHATKSGKFSTKVKFTFTPSTGKDRRKQSKALKVSFKKK
jgi:hypothetical protein